MNFPDIGLCAPQIFLPRENVDLTKWAVIACDQYTSQPDYWQQAAELIGEDPSTLKLTFPEVFLEQPDKAERISAINAAMRDYLEQGVLQPLPEGFVLVDRKTAQAPSRKGLMVALDLEQYDYRPGASSLIRATEGTILDRLPPRIQVREQACLELPHIMVLIDDPGQTVIEPLFKEELPSLYDFELMAGGGHLRGWQVSDKGLLEQVAGALAALADQDRFSERYQVKNEAPLLYAMGDGNHSFATAKAIWERLKAEAPDQDAIRNHPARWALVELVNLHDPGLEFEAIHRVLFGIEGTELLTQMESFFERQGHSFIWRELPSVEAVITEVDNASGNDLHRIPLVAGGRCGVAEISAPSSNLVVGTLQPFLDLLETTDGVRIDYIHGAEVVTELGCQSGNAGFFLPAISKFELFRTILLDGALPRKTFSMGEADEKRFYLECRKIK